MKNELLDEVWRVREEIATECGHDLKKLGEMLWRDEASFGQRLARLPICRRIQSPPNVSEEPPE
jgi:hypothetical protein